MKTKARIVLALAPAIAVACVAGCASVTNRSYGEPFEYVNLAAQEASATAGYEVQAVNTKSPRFEADRRLLMGFFLGDGGEHLAVDVRRATNGTEVEIRSQKQLFGFGAQRHMDDKVAEYMDGYLRANETLKEWLVTE